MPASHSDGDLIAAIYDAIIDPSRWDEVVRRIVEATKGVVQQRKHYGTTDVAAI